MSRHTKFITALAWEPLHLNGSCRRLASASNDGDVIIWDTVLGKHTEAQLEIFVNEFEASLREMGIDLPNSRSLKC